MRAILATALACLSIATSTISFADEFVRGYVRKDGTYVQPHYRSSPNRSTLDNYSTRGNVNPYTGERGSVDAFAPATPSYPSRPRANDFGLTPLQPIQPFAPYGVPRAPSLLND